MKTKRLKKVEMEFTQEEKDSLHHTFKILDKILIEMNNFKFDTVRVGYEYVESQDIEMIMSYIENFADVETMVMEEDASDE